MRLRRDGRRGRVRLRGGGCPKPPPSPCLLFLAALLATGSAASALADKRIGAVVQRHYNGATGLLPTAESQDLLFDYDVFAGETVKTPPNGSTVIRFQDKTQIQVGGNSSLVIDRYVYDPSSGTGDLAVRFGTGLFRFITGELKNKEDAKLTTPVSSLTIRGTKFILYVAPDGSTSLGVIKGAVDAVPCGRGSISEEAGQAVRIDPACQASQIALGSVPTDPITSIDYEVAEDVPAPAGGIGNDKNLHEAASPSEPGPSGGSPAPAAGPPQAGPPSSGPPAGGPPSNGPPSSEPPGGGPPPEGASSPPSNPPKAASPPPSGGSSGPSFSTRPGNGFGDVNHIHTGPPGLNGGSNGKGHSNGNGNAGGNANSSANGNSSGNRNSSGDDKGGGNGNVNANGKGHGP
jgi:hypothetical protein